MTLDKQKNSHNSHKKIEIITFIQQALELGIILNLFNEGLRIGPNFAPFNLFISFTFLIYVGIYFYRGYQINLLIFQKGSVADIKSPFIKMLFIFILCFCISLALAIQFNSIHYFSFYLLVNLSLSLVGSTLIAFLLDRKFEQLLPKDKIKF